jgi:four helix bundle protein
MDEARKRITSHRELESYQKAFQASIRLFELSKQFPREEAFSLTDQVRRSSRSVCANLAEAWRKRIYERAFVSKLSDAEAEAAEIQVWIEFAVASGYLEKAAGRELYRAYDEIIRLLVSMRVNAQRWIIHTSATLIQEQGETYADPF